MKTVFIAALAFGLAGCNDGSNSVGPNDSLSGEYALRTVNGNPLPYTFSDGSTVTSDVLTLFVDGTFSESFQLSDGRLFVDQGFYTANNGALTFNDQTIGVTYSGSISGTVLTEIFPNGLTEVFQRR
jgi:hypothetical protein